MPLTRADLTKTAIEALWALAETDCEEGVSVSELVERGLLTHSRYGSTLRSLQSRGLVVPVFTVFSFNPKPERWRLTQSGRNLLYPRLVLDVVRSRPSALAGALTP